MRRKVINVLVVASVVIVLGLAGCGSGGSGSTSDVVPTSQTDASVKWAMTRLSDNIRYDLTISQSQSSISATLLQLDSCTGVGDCTTQLSGTVTENRMVMSGLTPNNLPIKCAFIISGNNISGSMVISVSNTQDQEAVYIMEGSKI